MAFLDLVGIAAIVPFIGVISSPQIIHENSILSLIYEYFSFKKINNFILFLGVCFLSLFIVSLLFRLITNSFMIRWAAMREYSLSERLFKRYISQGYSWFLTKNSSSISKSVLSEVNTCVYLGIFPAIHIISQGVLVLSLLIMIFIANPYIAIFSFIVLILSYFVLMSFTSNYLAKMGIERLEENKQRFESLGDAFSAYKLSKLLNKENYFIRKFSFHSKNYCIKQSNAEIASTGPRYLLEDNSHLYNIRLYLHNFIRQGLFEFLTTNCTLCVCLFKASSKCSTNCFIHFEIKIWKSINRILFNEFNSTNHHVDTQFK